MRVEVIGGAPNRPLLYLTPASGRGLSLRSF